MSFVVGFPEEILGNESRFCFAALACGSTKPSRFIRLSNIIVNTSKIVTIDILPTKYVIFMCNHHLDGGWLFSSGKIEICQNKNPMDYIILTDWIKKIDPPV